MISVYAQVLHVHTEIHSLYDDGLSMNNSCVGSLNMYDKQLSTVQGIVKQAHTKLRYVW